MKKNYIKPNVGPKCMETNSLLAPSVYHADSTQAAAGDKDNPVNLGRGGSFWDDSE